MACELFIPWKPHAATLTVVEQANAIIVAATSGRADAAEITPMEPVWFLLPLASH